MSNIHDIDIFSRNNPDGTPLVHYDEDAIKNAMALWLSSKKGDFIKYPDRGGILDRTLFRQMSPAKIDSLTFVIKNAILREFSPEVKLLGVYVEPDYTRRIWVIDIEYINPLTMDEEAVTIYTKDLSKTLSFEYEEVELTGNNLRNFVIIKKPSMIGKLLKYDNERIRWKWGKYLFPESFTSSDPYFNEIHSYINS